MSADPSMLSATDLGALQARICAHMPGDPATAALRFEGVLARARQLGSAAQEAQALINLASCAFLRGDYARMGERSRAALDVAERGRLDRHKARALSQLGLMSERRGDLSAALAYLRKALRLAASIGDEENLCRAVGNFALIYGRAGLHEQALALHQRALELARHLGHHALIADMLGSIAEDFFYIGDMQQCLVAATNAISYPREHGMVRYECAARATRCRVLLQLGRLHAAQRASRSGQRVARWAGDDEMHAIFLWTEGEALSRLGDPGAAVERLRQSASAQRERRDLHQLALTLTSITQACEAAGDGDGAQAARDERHGIEQTLGRSTVQDALVAGAKDVPESLRRRAHAVLRELEELTEYLAHTETTLRNQLEHEPGLGVLTRHGFCARLQKALDMLGPSEVVACVVFSVSGLEAVPAERFGHVVSRVSSRLTDAARVGDIVGRTADDTFVVGLTDIASACDVPLVAERIARALREPFALDADSITLGAAAGWSVAPRDGEMAEAVLDRARASLSEQQPAGALAAAHAGASTALDAELTRAVADNEFTVFYQAICAAHDGSIRGTEALLRWNHPTRGVLPPDMFIVAAETSRHILDIGDWALREACRKAVEWDFDRDGLRMSVNVSAVQFCQPGFVAGVEAALALSGLAAEALVLEITESMVLASPHAAKEHAYQLREMGVGLALDDFGAGFSNLSVLHDLPFTILKVDRGLLSRVGAAGDDSRGRVLVSSTVSMARDLGLLTVAEGVEETHQWHTIRDIGFCAAQGYLLGMPVPADRFAVARAAHGMSFADVPPTGAGHGPNDARDTGQRHHHMSEQGVENR